MCSYIQCVFSVVFVVPVLVQSTDFKAPKILTAPIFYNLESILKVFDSQKHYMPREVEMVLKSFYEECVFAPDVYPQKEFRKSFIVIEGDNRDSRENIGTKLAERIGGRFLRIPPKCLANYTTLFSGGTLLRRAFFALSLYTAAYNVRQLWARNTPVVLNGYWTDQAAFILGKIYRRSSQLPPAGSQLYRLPDDLMIPDLVCYINYYGNLNSADSIKFGPQWRPKMLQIYQRFSELQVIVIDGSLGVSRSAETIHNYMLKLLPSKCDLSIHPPDNITCV